MYRTNYQHTAVKQEMRHTPRPVQELVNTLGIDCSIHMLIEYVTRKQEKFSNPEYLQFRLDPHSKYLNKSSRSGNVPAWEPNPHPFASRHKTTWPPAPTFDSCGEKAYRIITILLTSQYLIIFTKFTTYSSQIKLKIKKIKLI